VAVNQYKHTQTGWLTILALAVTAVFVLRALGGAITYMSLAATVGIAFVLLLFLKLTVSLDDSRVELRFGIGLLRKRIAFADIESYRGVRNHWYYGWGIKMIPGGWMWNIAGLSAVELRLRNGKLFRIGTDEPDSLLHAFERSLGRPPSTG